jgi:SAM-dependent methyltransferase
MLAARYDAVADLYEATFSDANDPVLRSLLDLLGSPENLRVLDVACGHGRVARALAGLGAAVTGVDLSRALLDKAQALEDAEPMGIRYVHADMASVPGLDDAAFDAAVCNFGLADIDNLGGALATVARLLRTGGAFVFSILHPCFSGTATVSGTWPATGRYHDEGYWVANSPSSTLRRQVGANHRTLSTYVNSLSLGGLRLSAMSEPDPPGEWTHDDRRDAARLPVFLVARCTKDGEFVRSTS